MPRSPRSAPGCSSRRNRPVRAGRRRIPAAGLARIVPACVWLAAAAPLAQQEITVSPTGPVRSLTEALRLAPPGGRIIVGPGVYREPTLLVEKPVQIVGRGLAVLDGEDQRQIMTIAAPDVRVSGLVFRNVPQSYMEERAGIEVRYTTGCVIERNRFENTYFAIYLRAVNGCRVTGNEIAGTARLETASADGIHAWDSRALVLQGNRVSGHRDGIYLEFVRGATIDDNVVEDNLRYGLHFMFSDGCAYARNLFRGNGAGVAVMYSANVDMVANRFAGNWGPASYGLLLKDIRDSRLHDNLFRNNTVGLFMDGASRVQIQANRFVANGWAIRIFANSTENVLARNDFIRNSFDVSTNSRQNFSTFVENYWDRYDGYDMAGDGFGDVPYHPVRLFSLLVEQNRPLLVLLRSPFVGLLDIAESVLPVLTPRTLVDERPAMRPLQ